MKKLLLKLLLAASPCILVIAYFELDPRIRYNNPYGIKRVLLENRLTETDFIALGSSHIQIGIHPEIFSPNGLNLGISNQTLYYETLLLEKYLDRLPRLKTVLLGISYSTLLRKLEGTDDDWRCYYYKYVFGLPHRSRKADFEAKNYSAFLLNNSFKPFWKIPQAFNDDRWRYNANAGWIESAYPRQTENLSAHGAQRVTRHHKDMRLELFSQNKAVLERFIARLSERGMHVWLIQPPLSRHYREHMDTAFQRLTVETLSELSERYNLFYRNYTDDPRFSDSDYVDSDHLNYAGSMKFSRILAEDAAALDQGGLTMNASRQDEASTITR